VIGGFVGQVRSLLGWLPVGQMDVKRDQCEQIAKADFLSWQSAFRGAFGLGHHTLPF
jgi:hypothetical protein